MTNHFGCAQAFSQAHFCSDSTKTSTDRRPDLRVDIDVQFVGLALGDSNLDGQRTGAYQVFASAWIYNVLAGRYFCLEATSWFKKSAISSDPSL